MKASKFWLIFVIFLVLQVSNIRNNQVFAGGRQQGAQGAVYESHLLNPLGHLPLLRERITLTMGMTRSPITPDLVNNFRTISLERDSNIRLEFVYYGASLSEARQRLEIEIMAGGTELPDIINFPLDSITQAFYGSQGMLIPLENYIRNSSYWMNELIHEMPYDPWTFVRSADGHIYSLFNYAGEFVTELFTRIYINTEWLNDAGLSLPTSTWEFENMLRAFRNRRPNPDGLRTFPFITERGRVSTTILDVLFSPFVYSSRNN